MTELLIALLGAIAGALLVWALGMRGRPPELPGEREAIERRREELREEEAEAVDEARERREEQTNETLVDWINRRFGLGRRDPGAR